LAKISNSSNTKIQ